MDFPVASSIVESESVPQMHRCRAFGALFGMSLAPRPPTYLYFTGAPTMLVSSARQHQWGARWYGLDSFKRRLEDK